MSDWSQGLGVGCSGMPGGSPYFWSVTVKSTWTAFLQYNSVGFRLMLMSILRRVLRDAGACDCLANDEDLQKT